MSILLKDIEELQSLAPDGDTFELDPSKKYLVIVKSAMRPEHAVSVRDAFKKAGIDALVLVGVPDDKLRLFEIECQVP